MVSDEETTADETADEETPAQNVDAEPTVDTDDDRSAAPSAERYGAIVTDVQGSAAPSAGRESVLHTDAEGYLEVASAAQADGFDQLIDLTAVDYLAFAAPRGLPQGHDEERFEVVTALINHESGERIRIRVQVSADEPALPSVFDLWPGSEALEREVFDMFGIEFGDHPDMSRILMPEDWIGFPLRKDYAVGSIPVQFKAASNIR
ncbi:MAG: NADH-quinone oxidoreductase subunit C [Acidimicrobiales bacterium]|nr:NADH-quinone oxidoreductase subunit C [Acidimicrobiales bacterium]